ncbi:MAG: lipoprotein [Gammaproteobacteria bacterium]
MTKLKLLSILLVIMLSGCGQKGPLLVKPDPPSKNDTQKDS